jgi:hypothetical protein
MNWVRENKFLTGFIAVMVIGAGALGYLLYTAWSTYADVSDEYNEQANSLHQLQTRVPFPSEENLRKYQAERDDFIDDTHALATDLSKMVLPAEDMTPSEFQDRLRDTVSTVVAEAGKAGVTLPAKFALDFDRYQTSPPAAEAAGPLGRQLTALKMAMDILINEKVDAVISLTRSPLTQEGAAAGAGGGGGGGFGGGGGRRGGGGGGGCGGGGGGRRGGGGGGGGGFGGGAAGGGDGLVQDYPFEVHFVASQPAFQKVLNDFAASNKQFFVTRTLLVENTKPQRPARHRRRPGLTPPVRPRVRRRPADTFRSWWAPRR